MSSQSFLESRSEKIRYLTFTGFLLAIMLFLNFFWQFSNHLITVPPSYLADKLGYQRHSRNLWSAFQKRLEPRKLTGTMLFQCEPLNCGTHYHQLDLRKSPCLASLKKGLITYLFTQFLESKSIFLENVFNICRLYTYTYRMYIQFLA